MKFLAGTLLFFTLLHFVFPCSLYAQKYNLTGKILDADTKEELSFANLKVTGTNLGTAANKNGSYILKLNKGSYTISVSYIGYKSDTLKITLTKNITHNFYLKPIELKLSEVTVTPGRNPAYDIIEKAIKQKNIQKEKLKNYKYSAYTKGIIKTTDKESKDSKNEDRLIISSIIENESRGFFKKPNQNKFYIVARKQSANTPPFINVVTGGNIIQSFYEDNLKFFRKRIPSPISDEALDYYYFYIEKELAIDDKKVYQIYFNTDNTASPGFYGSLFIADSTYNLLKVDAKLNNMANISGLFKYVKVVQQFTDFNNYTMPIDYRVFAEGNYLGIIKFGLELHTLMSSYEINSKIEDDFFGGAIISVLPDADKKTKEYSVYILPHIF